MYYFIGCKFNERFSLFSFSGAIYLHKLSLKKDFNVILEDFYNHFISKQF